MSQSKKKTPENVEVRFTLSDKQSEALEYLNDKTTREVVWGSGAGCGKSYLAVIWLIQCCFKYPGTRYLLGRTRLTDLKKSTVNTFFDICSKWGLQPDLDFVYNEQLNSITFKQTKSQILLFDLIYMPSDPNYDRLGSTEFTAAVLEEVPTIDKKAKNIVISRLRYKLTEYGLMAKCLMTTNPTKNHWAYTDFYKPWTQNSLPPHRKFVFATVRDNPYSPDGYLETLESLDEIERKRLLDGDWEYEEAQGQLIQYKNILNIFKDGEAPTNGDYYLSCDIANAGKDSTVLMVWNDNHIVKIQRLKQAKNPEIMSAVQSLISEFNIPPKNIIYDGSGGYGVGVGQYIRGSIPFINNARAFDPIYQNLKSQAFFKLANEINNGNITIWNCKDEHKANIIQELEVLRSDVLDLDQKLSIISKADIKHVIGGRSPDYADAMAFKMFYHLKNKSSGKYYAKVNQSNTNARNRIFNKEYEDRNKNNFIGK